MLKQASKAPVVDAEGRTERMVRDENYLIKKSQIPNQSALPFNPTGVRAELQAVCIASDDPRLSELRQEQEPESLATPPRSKPEQ